VHSHSRLKSPLNAASVVPRISSRIVVVLCLLLSPWVVADDLSIGRMQVAIWSEYDDPSVLTIYDGRFEDVTRFPIKTSFLVPKGSIISDACSLSHDGQHFCQLYTIKNMPEYDEVEVYLPYPNFYLSFHFTPFDVSLEKRAFNYPIRSNHPIARLEVDIQQPLRSTEFHISPDDGQLKVTDNQNHFYYSYEDVGKHSEKAFGIEYTKQDIMPSVDIKYSRMTGPKIFSSPYETQRNFRMVVYLISGSGVSGVVLLLLWLVRRKYLTGRQMTEGSRV
jgi:hypothetical protein